MEKSYYGNVKPAVWQASFMYAGHPVGFLVPHRSNGIENIMEVVIKENYLEYIYRLYFQGFFFLAGGHSLDWKDSFSGAL